MSKVGIASLLTMLPELKACLFDERGGDPRLELSTRAHGAKISILHCRGVDAALSLDGAVGIVTSLFTFCEIRACLVLARSFFRFALCWCFLCFAPTEHEEVHRGRRNQGKQHGDAERADHGNREWSQHVSPGT